MIVVVYVFRHILIVNILHRRKSHSILQNLLIGFNDAANRQTGVQKKQQQKTENKKRI